MRRCGVLFVTLLFVAPSLSQTIDQLSVGVVFLYRTEQHPVTKDGKPVIERGKQLMESQTKYGTGFFVTPDSSTMVLVTAEHVATDLESDFHTVLRVGNDTPLEMSSEELTGMKSVTWIAHGKADVAVAILHPTKDNAVKLAGHFMPKSQVSSDNAAPSRDRLLTTLGFPLALGVAEHFSPISRESKPVSGLLSLKRFDTHTPATFFLLGDPSIAGFSGAPVLLLSAPYSVPGQGMVFPAQGTPTLCVGIVHGTINDDTGGKIAAVTPSIYILETIDKAMGH
jgi:hypothetical protein